jgi:hypothetical protein
MQFVEYYTPDYAPPQPPPTPEPAPPLEPERRTLRNRLGGGLAALGVLLAKFKGVLLLLPKLKILTTSGSMLVSIGA